MSAQRAGGTIAPEGDRSAPPKAERNVRMKRSARTGPGRVPGRDVRNPIEANLPAAHSGSPDSRIITLDQPGVAVNRGWAGAVVRVPPAISRRERGGPPGAGAGAPREVRRARPTGQRGRRRA